MTDLRKTPLSFSLLLGLAMPASILAQGEKSPPDQRIAAVLAEHGGGSVDEAIARLDALLATGKAADGSLLAARYRLEVSAGKREQAAATLNKMATLRDSKWRTWAQARARELKPLDPRLSIDVLAVSPRLQALVNAVANTDPHGLNGDEVKQLVRVGSPAVAPLIAAIDASEPHSRREVGNMISILAEIGDDAVHAYFRKRLLSAERPFLRSVIAESLPKLPAARRNALASLAIASGEPSLQLLGVLARTEPIQPNELDGLEAVFEHSTDSMKALTRLPAGEPRVERWVTRMLRGAIRQERTRYYQLLDLPKDHPALVGRLAAAIQNPVLSSFVISRAVDRALPQDSELPARLSTQLSGTAKKNYLASLSDTAEVLPISLIDALGDDLFGIAICWPKFPVVDRKGREDLVVRIIDAFSRNLNGADGPRLELRYKPANYGEFDLFKPIHRDIWDFGWRRAAAALLPLLQHPDRNVRGYARRCMAHLVPARLLKHELAVHADQPDLTQALLVDHGDRSMLEAMIAAIPSKGFEMVDRILEVAEPEDVSRLTPVTKWIDAQRDVANGPYRRWVAWLDQHMQPEQASELLRSMTLHRRTDTLRVACEHSSKSDVPALVKLAQKLSRPLGSSEHLARALIRHGALDEAMQLAAKQTSMLETLESQGVDTTPAWTQRVADGLSDRELSTLLGRPETAKTPFLRDAVLSALSRGRKFDGDARALKTYFATMDPKLAKATVEGWLAPLQGGMPVNAEQIRPIQAALVVLGSRTDDRAVELLGGAIRPDLDPTVISMAIQGLRNTFNRKAVPHLIRALRMDAKPDGKQSLADQAQLTLDRLYKYFAEVERWQQVERTEQMIKQGLLPAGRRFDDKKK